MNEKFDELTKGLAQSVTRREALRKFGVGLAGIALAALGLTSQAEAGHKACFKCQCNKPEYGCLGVPDSCYAECYATCFSRCHGN